MSHSLLQATIHACSPGEKVRVPFGGQARHSKLGDHEVLVTVGTVLAAGKATDVRAVLEMTSSAPHLPKGSKDKSKKGKSKSDKISSSPLLLEAHTYTLWPRNFIRQVCSSPAASGVNIDWSHFCAVRPSWARLGVIRRTIVFIPIYASNLSGKN